MKEDEDDVDAREGAWSMDTAISARGLFAVAGLVNYSIEELCSTRGGWADW